MTTKAEYDTQASDYDETRFEDKMGIHLDLMHKKILSDLIDPSCERLLEAGVGTGRFSTWLAKKGFNMVGIDLSREMLKKAKDKKVRLNVNLDLVMADVHFLPFKKGAFSCGICINVMDHFRNTNGFLKQIRYVVKIEGSFIFNFSNAYSLYLPIALMVNSRGQALFRRDKIYSAWFTFRSIRNLLLINGFNIVVVKGCFVASPVPFGNKLIRFIQSINLSAKDSQLKFFAVAHLLK